MPVKNNIICLVVALFGLIVFSIRVANSHETSSSNKLAISLGFPQLNNCIFERRISSVSNDIYRCFSMNKTNVTLLCFSPKKVVGSCRKF